jgi:2-polyprenyl-6-methoxyphenol hydroxylase-like FAD-dependent oxidoreductase
MKQIEEKPIIVAGGGIGGCAAALAIAQKGRKVVLLEQAAEFAEIGAGIQLGPNAFRAFDQLGIRDAVDRLTVLPDALVLRDAVEGDIVTRMPLGEGFNRRFGQPYAVIYRADLHRVLVDACMSLPGIELINGRKIVSFDETDEGVRVTSEDGTTIVGEALIGADGLWSKVRQAIVGDGNPRVSGHIAYRAVLPVEKVPAELRFNEMVLWAGPKLHLVQYPLRRGELFNLVAVFHSDKYEEGWDTYGDSEELHLRFEAACKPVKTLLERIETWRMWVLCDREPVSHWSRGRVALLGDAAHPMLQYMAQGACMALEDALTLADCIHESNTDMAHRLERYWRQRYLRTARVQLTARMYGEVYHAQGPVRELRNAYLKARTPQAGLESLAWLYDPVA